MELRTRDKIVFSKEEIFGLKKNRKICLFLARAYIISIQSGTDEELIEKMLISTQKNLSPASQESPTL
jgi:hypothetical protein